MSDHRLAELIAPLSLAADVGAGLAPESSYRTTLLALALARRDGAGDDELRAIFYAGLLRHVGCTATAHEETRLMGDELELRSTLATVDAANPLALLRGAATGFARGRGAVARARAVVGFMAGAPAVIPGIFGARCEVAVRFAARLGLPDAVAAALDQTYERFDGKGQPRGLAGDALGRPARVLAVAELAALVSRGPGGDELCADLVRARAGTQLDPRLAALFARDLGELLAAVRPAALTVPLLAAEPTPHRRVAPEALVEVARVLADFVDVKSTFTLGHSRGVAALAREAGAAMGLDESERARVELAGLVHDLGRVSVSNAVWDKPGALDAGEWALVRAHPAFTERVVRASAPLAPLAELAGTDHRPLDPRDPPAVRLLAAADVLHALREPRSYRPAHEPAAAVSILEGEARAGRLDRAAVDAVLAAAGHRDPARARALLPAGLSAREAEILRLLARGLVDKEIAARLGISHRTVHHHNQSIYAKIGVATRGAAALYATEQGI